MRVRWSAILIGLLADILLTTAVQVFARPDFFPVPDLTNQADLAIIFGTAFVIGIGGYVSGRIAQQDRVINGLMVGILDVLVTVVQIGAMSRPVVYMEVLGCAFALLGGYLSQFPSSVTTTSGKQK